MSSLIFLLTDGLRRSSPFGLVPAATALGLPETEHFCPDLKLSQRIKLGDRMDWLRVVARGYNLDRWSGFSMGIQRSERCALAVIADEKLAMLPDDHGRPLLFKAVSNHERIAEIVLNDPKLACMEWENGLTVAHVAVAHHRRIAQRLLDQRSPLLQLKTKMGVSVELFARISLGIA